MRILLVTFIIIALKNTTHLYDAVSLCDQRNDCYDKPTNRLRKHN